MEGTVGSGPAAASAPRLSIILATLNERENIASLVARIRPLALPPFEVIVVDDGSTDGTREFVSELARSDARFRTLFHDGKQTTVRAQGQGIASANGELVAIMDADLQHPPETLPELVRALDEGGSLAIASRYVRSGSPGERSLGRALISRTAEWVARRALPEARRVSDPMSGYFVFRRSVFRPLDPTCRGYKLLLFLLVMNGARPVREVGFRFAERTGGKSKLTSGPAFIRIFLGELRRVRAYRRARGPSP